MRFLYCAVIAILLVAFSGGRSIAQSPSENNVAVTNAWPNATPHGSTIGAIYMTLVNNGKDADRLLAGTTRSFSLARSIDSRDPTASAASLLIGTRRVAVPPQSDRETSGRPAEPFAKPSTNSSGEANCAAVLATELKAPHSRAPFRRPSPAASIARRRGLPARALGPRRSLGLPIQAARNRTAAPSRDWRDRECRCPCRRRSPPRHANAAAPPDARAVRQSAEPRRPRNRLSPSRRATVTAPAPATRSPRPLDSRNLSSRPPAGCRRRRDSANRCASRSSTGAASQHRAGCSIRSPRRRKSDAPHRAVR